MTGKKRIVIAEDQRIVRKGLCSLLTPSDEFEIVGEAEDGLDAVRRVQACKPDLVLLDLSMPKLNGIAAIKEIKHQYPETKIMALTVHGSDQHIIAAFEAGADGYCLKDATHDELLTSIRSVLSGKTYLSPEVSKKVLEGYLEGRKTLKRTSSWDRLTQREKEVLKLVGEGYKTKEIADCLCISWKTVQKHRANIMDKLGVHTASALTAYAIEKGLVSR
jgi:two-component system, NarL family, response regulator NreC